MNKILIAEPIYSAMPPSVYFNRIAFWREISTKEFSYGTAEPLPQASSYAPGPAEFDLGFKAETTLTRNYDHRPMVMGPRNGIRYARDRAIRAALEFNASHLLFIDDDILVPPDILSRLLAVGQPIVGGLIHRDNGDPLVFRGPRMDDDMAAIEAYIGHPVEELVWKDHPKSYAFACAAVAAGCMLIQTSVLAAMQDKRWLFNYDDTDRSMDVNFCRAARAHGFTVWCWPDEPCTQIEHYGK